MGWSTKEHVRNGGIELEIETIPKERHDFGWKTGGVISMSFRHQEKSGFEKIGRWKQDIAPTQVEYLEKEGGIIRISDIFKKGRPRGG